MLQSLARVVFFALLSGMATLVGQEPPKLASAGHSDYAIVLAGDADPAVRHAAEELQRLLAQLTTATLRIETGTGPLPAHAILVGPSAATKALGLEAAIAALPPEGYLLRTVGERLAIAGRTGRGTLYGVYGLLQDHFGCRWFTPEVARIPAGRFVELPLPQLDETQAPALEYRDVFTFEGFDGEWSAHNRVNSSHARLLAEHGGRVEYFGFVHTFAELLPPAQHFATHPEYYSEIGGKRVWQNAQLCCTNPEVVQLVTAAVRQRMKEHPEAVIFSVSQNDCFGFCTCATCKALAEAEGSQMAPVLQLVNAVADAVQTDFPDQLVDTLAYQWTRHPPKSMRPRPNVVVRLCSIECCFSHAFADCPTAANKAFVDDLRGWAKVCDRLWMWDYTTDFAHYLLPLPNLDVLDANIRLLAQNHVTGIFEEGDYSSPHGEFQQLRGYVLARCLWDPATDGTKARDEFLDGVYGRAAAPIRAYLAALQAAAAQAGHCGIYQGPDAPWLLGDWQPKADAWWDEAERLCGGDAALLARVRAARLSVDYAPIERARQAQAPVSAELKARVERFFAVAKASGVLSVREGGGDLAGYERQVRQALGM